MVISEWPPLQLALNLGSGLCTVIWSLVQMFTVTNPGTYPLQLALDLGRRLWVVADDGQGSHTLAIPASNKARILSMLDEACRGVRKLPQRMQRF